MAFPRRLRQIRSSGDEGAALMVALIFMLVVGLVVAATLTKSGSVMKTNLLVRDTAQVQYGADAAVDRALQVLRSDLATATPSLCPNTSASTIKDFGSGDSSGFTVTGNSHTMHYTCQTVNGSIATPGGQANSNYAVAVTSTAGDGLTTSSAVGNAIPVDGAIYLGGTETSGDLKKEVDVSNGSIVQYDSNSTTLATCTTALKALSNLVTATSGFSKVCGSQTPVEAIPQVALPSAPTGTTDPAYVDYPSAANPTCRIFLPGKYTTIDATTLLGGTGGSDSKMASSPANYFLSGLYYFTGGVTVDKNDVVYGGLPNTSRSDITAAATPWSTGGCKDFDGVDLSVSSVKKTALAALFLANGINLSTWPNSIWNHGVEWIMGNGAGVTVKTGTMSLSSPDPSKSDVNGKKSLSLVAARADKWITSGTKDSANYAAWTTGGGSVLSNNNANADMVINGKILAPDASIALFATNPSYASARAGVVANTLDLQASSAVSADQFAFKVDDDTTGSDVPPQRRTVKIVATVDGSSLTETVVATIDNFGTRPIRVFSWRVS